MTSVLTRVRLLASAVLFAGALVLYTARSAAAAQFEECTCDQWATAFAMAVSDCEVEHGAWQDQTFPMWCAHVADCISSGGEEFYATWYCNFYYEPPACSHTVAPNNCQ